MINCAAPCAIPADDTRCCRQRRRTDRQTRDGNITHKHHIYSIDWPIIVLCSGITAEIIQVLSGKIACCAVANPPTRLCKMCAHASDDKMHAKSEYTWYSVSLLLLGGYVNGKIQLFDSDHIRLVAHFITKSQLPPPPVVGVAEYCITDQINHANG